ncbi:MAG: tRNA (adenosine(37)-N6)-threonylcarbamoyltransferase complex transferase subunit TsaD [Halobacteriovoraceae bacterium]|jgi:N6-L-threonylcarbamoyladenine synthase|nr:tRNA (adenosine(37)-N6)-threonylcarbamoyltransferase complex transferase subunit TsaD [Halobacteriovoraceae bacterium]
MPIILGIETSCDDTSVCLLKGQLDDSERPEVLALSEFSQEEILKKWGGVVPEIAARNHMMKLSPLIEQVFEKAALAPDQIDAIAVTTNPGLLGPLLTGLNGAKTLALLTRKPIIPINHLYAHIEAIHLTEKLTYPYLGMVVSGGHSLFLLVNDPTEFNFLGGTLDDAAGEAFDKGGKLLGLGYPAGKIIDQLASTGNPKRYPFPIGLKNSKDCNLSFSGTKTSLRTFLEKNPEFDRENDLADLCASYQESIVDSLALKLGFAKKPGLPIVVGGGVAANSRLRAVLQQRFEDVHFVAPKFCTDNGAMIANYGLRLLPQAIPFPECLEVDARGKFLSKEKRLEQARRKKRQV